MQYCITYKTQGLRLYTIIDKYDLLSSPLQRSREISYNYEEKQIQTFNNIACVFFEYMC